MIEQIQRNFFLFAISASGWYQNVEFTNQLKDLIFNTVFLLSTLWQIFDWII